MDVRTFVPPRIRTRPSCRQWKHRKENIQLGSLKAHTAKRKDAECMLDERLDSPRGDRLLRTLHEAKHVVSANQLAAGGVCNRYWYLPLCVTYFRHPHHTFHRGEQFVQDASVTSSTVSLAGPVSRCPFRTVIQDSGESLLGILASIIPIKNG